jgi:hypothetical protein
VDIHPGFQKRHHHAADREDASRQASERRTNTNTNAFANGNRHTDPNSDTEPNTNGHADSKSNTHSDADRHA